MIDLLLHPLIPSYPQLLAVDTLLHGLVEGNVEESIAKFLRYTGCRKILYLDNIFKFKF